MSPLEQHVAQAVGKAQPGAAVDFGVIMQIMSTVLQVIQQCPFGNSKRAIRDGAVEAKVAAYRAVKSSGYDGNAVDLTNALIEQGRQATDDELDATIASAHALPAPMRSMGAMLLTCLMLGSVAFAGPFPERKGAASDVGPFPTACVRFVAGSQRLEDDDRQPEEPSRTIRSASSGEPPNPGSRILNPPQRSLRQRIADYGQHGGGTVGVRGMTITTHLQRDHGWSATQLTGLSADELYMLHGMQHAGRIDPHNVGRSPTANVSGFEVGYPASQSGGTTYWQVDGVRWSNLGGGAPVEGQTYTGGGRSFVYHAGRMYDNGAIQSSLNCTSGRCSIR